MKNWLITSALLMVSSSAALAQDDALPQGFSTEPLLKSTTTDDGDPLQFASGTPEIVSVIGTLEPGGQTARHQHPVPVYVYVLEGELEVRSDEGEPRTYSAGEAFLESVDRWHQGFNTGDVPTKVLVVFFGAEGQPTTTTE